jgi:hypothetical protein
MMKQYSRYLLAILAVVVIAGGATVVSAQLGPISRISADFQKCDGDTPGCVDEASTTGLRTALRASRPAGSPSRRPCS